MVVAMFFKQKSNIIFRNYESFGYITDNRNFGYKLTNNNEDFIGDKILSKSATVFFAALDRTPQSLDTLSKKINEQFTDTSIETIINDAKETALNEIWNNSEKIQYLRKLRNKDFPKCIKCSDKEFCTMCMVRNANENSLGDPLVVNKYFCSIAKINKKITLEWKEKRIKNR